MKMITSNRKYKMYYNCRFCGLKFFRNLDLPTSETEPDLKYVILNQSPTSHHQCFPDRVGVADLTGIHFTGTELKEENLDDPLPEWKEGYKE